MKFQGTFTALITPFKNGGVDEASLRRLIRFQIKSQISGLVPCGSTGEAATLDPDEYERVIAIAVEEARGRVPVVPGVGTNSTEKSVLQAKAVEALGADAILAIVPYYNKPTQEGLFLHFKALASAIKIPLIVYNIPGRTAVNLLPETLARLAAACPNIAATKDAAGSLEQTAALLHSLPKRIAVLSGDDALTLPMMSLGARGVISVASNLFPREMSAMTSAALREDYRAARKIHEQLYPAFKALFVETNPIPVKAAAKLGGLGNGEPRAPLTPLTPRLKAPLAAALRRAGFRRIP